MIETVIFIICLGGMFLWGYMIGGGQKIMTHALVISKGTGLVRDEYYSIPPIIKKHEDKVIDGVMQDCFVFKFASGNYAFYSNKGYRYELRSGFVV